MINLPKVIQSRSSVSPLTVASEFTILLSYASKTTVAYEFSVSRSNTTYIVYRCMPANEDEFLLFIDNSGFMVEIYPSNTSNRDIASMNRLYATYSYYMNNNKFTFIRVK